MRILPRSHHVRLHARACGLALVAVLVHLPASSGHANGPTIGFNGGSIVPLANPDVRLLSESVDLHLPLTDDYETGRAECFYRLVNLSGRTRSFAMSFVGASAASWAPRPGVPSGMRVRVRGQDVPVRMERADSAQWARFEMADPDSLPVWNVSIPGGETTHVEIEYVIEWSGGSEGSADNRHFDYFARPAALWAGTIGRATFRIHLGTMVTSLLRDRAINRDDYAVRMGIVPPDARWTFDGLEWKRTDWEPDTDFRFSLDWDLEPQPDE